MTNSDDGHHAHSCLFCGLAYECGAFHERPYGDFDSLHEGARCCLACRTSNLAALDRIEQDRRRRLYVG